jgi:2-polyprenyl-3-methyl-5-hydroxy-6-metoxy-1,4-benzoquinol methylase
MSVEYYNLHAQTFYEGTVNVDMSDLHNRFLTHVKPGGHILDAGCGSGRDSLAFLKMGYEVSSFDASQEMVRMSSELVRECGGEPTRLMTFQQVEDEGEYDGIWASASLLHVSSDEMDEVISKLVRALKPGGVLYASFKYGKGEVEREGRTFTMYTEESIEKQIGGHNGLKKLDLWTTQDVRVGREHERWVNGIWRMQWDH